MALEWEQVIVDAADPSALGRWWATALEWVVFNDDPEEEAILLVFKAKPLFLFMHLLFQKIVEWPPEKLPEGQTEYKPPADV